jgi:hypothetical protein
MPRRANRTTPLIMSGVLYTDDAATGTRIGSPDWFAWLTTATTFYYQSATGSFSAHHERRTRGGQYWIAYHRQAGVLQRVHLGKAHLLTHACLENAALILNQSATQKENAMHIP